MIRVLILADSVSRARGLGELFAEDDRFEIIGARTPSYATDRSTGFVNVIVAVAITPAQLPPEGAIVYLTDSREPVNFGGQVCACLPLDSSPSEIVAAVTAAASNLVVLTPQQARRWLPADNRGARPDLPAEALTSRELEVLRLLAGGWGNKQIAGELGVSDHTAKFHVAQILAKLGAASRTEAVSIAIRRGLIPI